MTPDEYCRAIEGFREARPQARGDFKGHVQALDALIWEKELLGRVPQVSLDLFAKQYSLEVVLLLTSIDRDGTGEGFDCELLAAAAARVNVPIIASGGAGRAEDFAAALAAGAAAVLAAGLFHRQEISVPELKRYLAAQGFPVRGAS